MLTIKAVYSPNREEIFEAERVSAAPFGAGGAHVNVTFDEPGNCGKMVICNVDCRIYVMNNKGSTIAVY